MSDSRWADSPAVTIDLDVHMNRRFAGCAGPLAQSTGHVLESIQAEAPANALSVMRMLDLRTGRRFARELKAIGRVCGLDWRWLLAANAMYDFSLRTLGCSTTALATPDGPVLARNMDWWPAELLARASCTLDYVGDGQRHFVSAGWVGMVGIVSAMSGRGFALAVNAVLCREPGPMTAYPVLLHLRRVMDKATDFDQAVDMLTDIRLMAPALITVIGTENQQRVCVERTPTRHALRWAKDDQPLVTTNDYRSLTEQNATPNDDRFWASSCPRREELERLSDVLAEGGEFSDQILLETLTAPGIFQPITAQHVIMRPATNAFRCLVPTTWPQTVEPPTPVKVEA